MIFDHLKQYQHHYSLSSDQISIDVNDTESYPGLKVKAQQSGAFLFV